MHSCDAVLSGTSLLEDLQFCKLAESASVKIGRSVFTLHWPFWIILQQHFPIACNLKANQIFQKRRLLDVLTAVRLLREAERV